MAGSYNHVVDDQGRLLDGEGINSMLECMSGDVVECVEEMYGMIWYLADRLAAWNLSGKDVDGDRGEVHENIKRASVDLACQNYCEGLTLSPGTGAVLSDEE